MSLSPSRPTRSSEAYFRPSPDAFKECPICLKTKPLGDFGIQRSNKDGRDKRCKKCSIKRSVGTADERPCDDCKYEQRCADLAHTCLVFRHWVESGVTVDRERIPDERL